VAENRPDSSSDAGRTARREPRFGFSRAVRLRRSEDFRVVQTGGRKQTTRHLVGLYRPNALEAARVGFAVSRKVGNAVVRNRVKRWLREAARHERHGLPPVDLVLIARPAAASSSAHELRDEVAILVGRIRSSAS
jgi:ribonuclease P protein component